MYFYRRAYNNVGFNCLKDQPYFNQHEVKDTSIYQLPVSGLTSGTFLLSVGQSPGR